MGMEEGNGVRKREREREREKERKRGWAPGTARRTLGGGEEEAGAQTSKREAGGTR